MNHMTEDVLATTQSLHAVGATEDVLATEEATSLHY